MKGTLLLVACACLLLPFKAGANEKQTDIRFNQHIRPILSEYCFACHGPDSASRKADLQLDTREGALESGVIVPGNVERSELISRISSDDPDVVMPPPEVKKRLEPEHKRLLTRWIAAGAQWEQHWAFVTPRKAELPQPAGVEGWARNPIDHFLLEKLREQGLTPNDEADRHTLARRIALDLTGLPPTPEMVRSFCADRGEKAYDRYVDLVLGSVHAGEHRARFWLDAARMATPTACTSTTTGRSDGLGTMNRNLPEFVILNCEPRGQALYTRLWGSGFLPSRHAGVAFRSQGDPVLYLSNPGGVNHEARRLMLDRLQKMNRRIYEEVGDPETTTRIAQYEMAFRMQSSVPELLDVKGEPRHILDLYGDDVEKPGTFAANCLLARRMAERGVRFVQIFHRGWDHHGELPKNIRRQTKEVDQPAWALVQDLKQRGLLDDTLVIWGGEFGRTIYCQGRLTKDDYGRDHHPRCYTMWFAGGGVNGGVTYGETDEFSYNIVRDPAHIRDVNATILHLLGIDHERFSVKHRGLDERLTGVQEEARAIRAIMA